MRKEEQAAVLICIQLGIPVTMWGPSGQGKSSFIRRSVGEGLGYLVEVLRVNTMLPHHLGGSPVPNADGTAVNYVPPGWVLKLNEAEKSLVFLDDISLASHATQTAALNLMDERTIGGVRLKALAVAAANPNHVATPRFPIDAAVSNRSVHVFINSSGRAYREGMMNGFPVPKVPKLKPAWEHLFRAKADLVTKFLDTPEGEPYVNKQPDEISPNTLAWPSERSWEMLIKSMAACDSLEIESMDGTDLREVRRILCHGTIGRAAYEVLIQYYTKPMKTNVDGALRQGRRFRFPESGDEMFGLLEAMSAHLASGVLSLEQWNGAWGFVEGCWQTDHRDRLMTFVLDLLSLNQGKFALPTFYSSKVRQVLESTI